MKSTKGAVALFLLPMLALAGIWDFPSFPRRPGTLCREEASSSVDVPALGILKVARNCLTALNWISPEGEPWEYNVSASYERNFRRKDGKVVAEEVFDVGGTQLTGTPRERQYFLKLAGVEKSDGYFVPDDVKERIEAGGCGRPAKVLCALGALYGQNEEPRDPPSARTEAGMRAMNIALDFGYMVTPRKYVRLGSSEKRRASAPPEWSLRSITDMDTLFRKFPPAFRRMDTIKYIYRTMSRDQNLMSMRTNAWTYNGEVPEIVFKQSTFNELRWSGGTAVGVEKGDQMDGSCTMAHEFSHAFEFQFPEKVLALGLFKGNVDGWGFSISSTKGIAYRGLEKISSYAFTNRHEYFAVAMGEFYCSPERLLKNAPELFAAIRDGIFEGRDFLPKGDQERDSLKRKIHERRAGGKEGEFALEKLSRNLANECLGGPNIQAKWRVDPETGKGMVLYYKKGFIREGGRIRQVLLGRTGGSDYFHACLVKGATKLADAIVGKYDDCHPPDKNGLVDNIVSGAKDIIDGYDDLIRKKAGPRVAEEKAR